MKPSRLLRATLARVTITLFTALALPAQIYASTPARQPVFVDKDFVQVSSQLGSTEDTQLIRAASRNGGAIDWITYVIRLDPQETGVETDIRAKAADKRSTFKSEGDVVGAILVPSKSRLRYFDFSGVLGDVITDAAFGDMMKDTVQLPTSDGQVYLVRSYSGALGGAFGGGLAGAFGKAVGSVFGANTDEKERAFVSNNVDQGKTRLWNGVYVNFISGAFDLGEAALPDGGVISGNNEVWKGIMKRVVLKISTEDALKRIAINADTTFGVQDMLRFTNDISKEILAASTEIIAEQMEDQAQRSALRNFETFIGNMTTAALGSVDLSKRFSKGGQVFTRMYDMAYATPLETAYIINSPLLLAETEAHDVLENDLPAASFVSDVAAGENHTCALMRSGSVKCWGYNGHGQLGDGTREEHPTPVIVKGITGAVAISAGANHNCALLSDGKVQCWGLNDFGQVGNGTSSWIQSAQPTTVFVAGITDASAVEAGDNFTCALLSDGSVKCWGANHSRQLGVGDMLASNAPVTINGITGAVAISAGEEYACAILSDGSVKCWGNNFYGQLGDGTTEQRLAPVTVNGITGAVAISAGDVHTCAILSDGSVKCWGAGSSQLGNGTSEQKYAPVTVNGITGAVAISAGEGYACAILSDGSVKCWGAGNTGQLGHEIKTADLSPVLDIDIASKISTGKEHACAALADGMMKCWGDNGFGKLGNNTYDQDDSFTPVSVIGL